MIGSGVVWADGASQAPSTPVVPMLIAAWPSAAQIWRVKVATEVLPFVPVTATIVSGCAPNHSAAAPGKRRARVLGHDQRHVGVGQRLGASRAPFGIGQDGHRPLCKRRRR